ncbi:DUF3107 domain-containing protein [Leucobacter weissii]|uniref:DUF3107 domain-containing protein n=1 Tax=Leucobacter weissii TaxID=1983706 RepID=UPI003132A604
MRKQHIRTDPRRQSVEVRIGIVHSPRELTFETDTAAEELRTILDAALAEGKQPLVAFTDTKGKQYFVPTAGIAYVELGGEGGRKVGFIS